MLILATVLVCGACVVAHGLWHRNSPVFGRVQGRLRGSGRLVAITFDDGPNPAATPRILDALRALGVPATFFLLGKHVERWPDIARRIAAEGHEVGNHGYHHHKLHGRGPAYIALDLALGAQAIERATGRRPRLFRAPHGFRNPWVGRAAAALGQRVVGWTLGVWDTDRPGSTEIARRCVDGARAGAILLLHDGDGYDPDGDRTQTADALPVLVRELRARGFEFVTLSA